MGLVISRILSLIQSPKPCRILMLGLANAGKTSILYRLKLGEVIETIPTIGFNVETVEYKNISFTMWDVGTGAQNKMRKAVWQHYFPNTSAIIYVVDSNDLQSMDEAKEELDMMFDYDEIRDCPLLVMANKQDLPKAASTSWIADALNLQSLRRPWHVQGTCAVNASGIYESLDWLAKEVTK